MAINFPDSPSAGDPHTEAGVSWTYDGEKWVSNNTAAPAALWTRAGTVLSPATAGDDVDLGTGDLSAAAGRFSGTVDIAGNTTIGSTGGTYKLGVYDTGKPQARFQDSSGTGQITFIGNVNGETIIRSRNNTNNGDIVFEGNNGTTGTEYARIKADGSATFAQKVTIYDGLLVEGGGAAGTVRAKQSADNSNFTFLGANISGLNVFRVQANGELQIGTNNTDQNITLKPDGNAYKRAGGTAWTAYSDSRLKENVAPYGKGLAEILKVDPVTFDFIDGSKGEVSVIAQDLEPVFPECVTSIPGELPDGSTADDVRTFNPTALQFAMINAVKEMATRIEALEAEVQALKGGS